MSAPSQTWSIRSSDDWGRAIADLRALHGITQAELASEAGISRGYIANIESGRSSRLIEQLLRIFRRLGATVTISFDASDREQD